jgi:hypothetical protein
MATSFKSICNNWLRHNSTRPEKNLFGRLWQFAALQSASLDALLPRSDEVFPPQEAPLTAIVLGSYQVSRRE